MSSRILERFKKKMEKRNKKQMNRNEVFIIRTLIFAYLTAYGAFAERLLPAELNG